MTKKCRIIPSSAVILARKIFLNINKMSLPSAYPVNGSLYTFGLEGFQTITPPNHGGRLIEKLSEQKGVQDKKLYITIVGQYGTYKDINLNETWFIPLEAGNPVDANAAPNAYTVNSIKVNDGDFRNHSDFTHMRFIFRMAPLDGGDGDLITMQPMYTYERNSVPIGTPFKVRTTAGWRGYITYQSPWFTFGSGDRNAIGLKFIGSDKGTSRIRIGTVMIQYGNQNNI